MNDKEILEAIEKNNKKRNSHINEAMWQLNYAMLGSCTCLTKTPDIQYHNDKCTYKKLSQAQSLLESCIVK